VGRFARKPCRNAKMAPVAEHRAEPSKPKSRPPNTSFSSPMSVLSCRIVGFPGTYIPVVGARDHVGYVASLALIATSTSYNNSMPTKIETRNAIPHYAAKVPSRTI
jgi:hypothetical protein